MKQIILLLVIFCQHASAQSYAPIRKAEKALSKSHYCCAAKLLEEANADDPDNHYIHYRLGYAYYMMNKYQDAIEHYEAAKPLMKDSMKYHFEMYHIYSSAGLASFAKQSFINYVHLCPSCVKSDLLPGVTSNKLMYRKPIKEPKLMGYETRRADYYPYIIDDNHVQHLRPKLSKGKPTHSDQYKKYLTKHFSDKDFLFYADKSFTRRNKSEGSCFGPFTLSKKLDKMYITRWNSDAKKMHIYFASKDPKNNEDWNSYKMISIEGDNGSANFIHPMLTKDEKNLIFASDRSGGLGGYDLWMGELEGDTKLKNLRSLGTYVNTPGDEVFPSVFDDDVLFFASNGHYGFGGLDIYAAVKSREKYRKTYNLGNRYNSTWDDYALFYNKKKNQGFFSSNRYQTEGDSMAFDRIYNQSFDKIKAVVDVMDQHKKSAPDVKVEILSEKIAKMTDANGKAEMDIFPVGYKRVTVSGEKYYTIDTAFSPFENRLNLKIEKKAPRDIVSFALLSHPYEHPARNAFYVLTSTKDGRRYTGVSDAYGQCEATLYADETYDLEVPSYGFIKKDVTLGGGVPTKFQIISDQAPKTVTKSSSTAEKKFEAPLTDNYEIYYENSQYVLTENVNRQIQNTVSILNQNPMAKLEIKAHTDCQGDSKLNMDLSKFRLQEVKNLFFARGVSESQMIGKYVGENDPANHCKCDGYDNYNCSSDEMKKNRRTEITIIR